jgi:RNA polymerase sigma factor (sigma-70 family)
MVVIAGEARLLGFGRRDARSEVDRLYRRHADEVLRYAMLVLRSRPDAEDVVQATFMRALRAISRGERVQKPRNWLIKIAHNECRRALSVRSRRAEVELAEVPSEAAETGRADELRRALAQLAPKQRDALVLRELEGRSYAEIAQTLGISGSAVETLLFRARRAVREQLEIALSCDEAVELIAADVLAEDDRTRLRAHTRACADCATLERQARGRKGALRRIASSFGLPWFGKTAAVLLTVSAAATTTGVVVLGRPAHSAPSLRPTPTQTVQQSTQPAPAPVAPQPVRAVHRSARHGAPAARRSAIVPARATVRHRAPVEAARAPAPATTPAAGTPGAAPTAEPTAPTPHTPPPSTAVPAAAAPLAPVTNAVPPVQAPPVVTAVADPVVNGVVEPVVTGVVTPVQAVTESVTPPAEQVVQAVEPVTDAVTDTAGSAVAGATTALPPPVGGLLGHK